MQLQILSDLHLEIERPGSAPGQEVYYYDIPVRADHLALLGDIGWTVEPRLFIWLKDQLKLFKTIFFVSGNHGTPLSFVYDIRRNHIILRSYARALSDIYRKSVFPLQESRSADATILL